MTLKGWIVPTDDVTSSDTKCWYLPFFVTEQDKARIAFDGAATFKGATLNDAVHSGINLLNSLAEVLTRFRVGSTLARLIRASAFSKWLCLESKGFVTRGMIQKQ